MASAEARNRSYRTCAGYVLLFSAKYCDAKRRIAKYAGVPITVNMLLHPNILMGRHAYSQLQCGFITLCSRQFMHVLKNVLG